MRSLSYKIFSLNLKCKRFLFVLQNDKWSNLSSSRRRGSTNPSSETVIANRRSTYSIIQIHLVHGIHQERKNTNHFPFLDSRWLYDASWTGKLCPFLSVNTILVCSPSWMARFTSPANHADVMSWWVRGGVISCLSLEPNHPFYPRVHSFWREQRLFLPFIWLFCLFSYNFAVFLVRLDSFPFILFRYAIDFIS